MRMANDGDEQRCPRCGGEFHTVTRPALEPESKKFADHTKARAKIDKARGPLQRCACGYERREGDLIVPGEQELAIQAEERDN
jgi:hypothetical protein